MDTTSSSSASFDEELDRIMELVPEIRQVRSRRDPFNLFDNREFKERYRFSKQTVNQLLYIIGENLINVQKNNEVTPINQLLIILRYYATGSFQQVLGDHINVHKSTVCRIVHRVGH
ncbi:hypothetical protein RN001_011901 [Aquatica leii]|uniref:Nuclease HARBI1 n=1 Tax=Aquatica leii TaxID=1421715 RepID=A0AAN7PSD0_9COLE|nr:hypothetical protein RN001_011901 [Aquatica leii]